MTNPETDIPLQIAKLLPLALSGNWPQVAVEAAKLVAMVEAELAPAIDAPALDPGDRAAVDAAVDAGVSKT